MDASESSWDAAWVAALDDLELTLTETERLLAGDPPAASAAVAWTPPKLDSPLPPELLERATVLLGRQQNLISATTAAMTTSRQHTSLIGRVADVSGVRRSEHSVYLDVRA